MATQTQHPSANGGQNNWNPNTGNRVDAVAADDGDTTYIDTSGSGQRQSFTFPVFSVGASDTVNSVTLHGMFKFIGTSSQVRLNLRNEAASVSEDIDRDTVTSYGLVSRAMTLNPHTAGAWTPNQVNSEASTANRLNEIEVRSIGPNTAIRCTEFWIVVDYTPAGGGKASKNTRPWPLGMEIGMNTGVGGV